MWQFVSGELSMWKLHNGSSSFSDTQFWGSCHVTFMYYCPLSFARVYYWHYFYYVIIIIHNKFLIIIWCHWYLFYFFLWGCSWNGSKMGLACQIVAFTSLMKAGYKGSISFHLFYHSCLSCMFGDSLFYFLFYSLFVLKTKLIKNIIIKKLCLIK